jgi:hypothetical protein
MPGARVKVYCPCCGFGHDAERLLKKPLRPVEAIVKWITSRGRGKLENHYRKLSDQGESRNLFVRLVAGLVERLETALEQARELLERLRPSTSSPMEPFASGRAVESFVSLQREMSRSTLVSVPMRSTTCFPTVSIRVPLRTSR